MRAEQGRLHAETWPAAAVGSLVLALVVVGVLFPVVRIELLLAWLAAVGLLFGARVAIGRAQLACHRTLGSALERHGVR